MKKEKLFKKETNNIFTKNNGKGIINLNCGSLKANYKNLFEKDGLIMKDTKEVILYKEKKIRYNKNFITLLIKICNDLKIYNYEIEIKRFLENK